MQSTYFGGVDANWNSCTIGLLSLDPLNVDHELFTVALGHLAHLLAFVVASNNLQITWKSVSEQLKGGKYLCNRPELRHPCG